MAAAARARPHLVTQVVPAPFSLGVDATVLRMLSSGDLGDLLFIEHRQPGGFLDRDGPLTWRRDPQLSGLNVMMLGIVYEMVLRWVGEATRVTASGSVFVRRRLDAEGRLAAARIPDHLDVLADLACGAKLHIQQSGVTAFQEGAGTWIYGTEGVLRFHDERLFFGRRGETALAPVEIPDSERGGWRVEEEFVGAIRGEEPVRRTTFEDGVRYMEFVEAAWRSLATGRSVALPLRIDGPGAAAGMR